MNKTAIIDIEFPVMAGLAKLALFGEIQKTFNLYPGKIAKYLIGAANKERQKPAAVVKNLAKDLIPMAQAVFLCRLGEAQALLSKEKTPVRTMSEVPLTRYFNLDPEEVAEMVRDGIKRAGMNPMELVDGNWTQGEVVMINLRSTIREIIPWVFQEAVRIVMQQESQK